MYTCESVYFLRQTGSWEIRLLQIKEVIDELVKIKKLLLARLCDELIWEVAS